MCKTIAAVQDATARGRGIVTSTGMPTWEVSLWAAARAGAAVMVVIPDCGSGGQDSRTLTEDFGIPPEVMHTLTFPMTAGKHRPKEAWPRRDSLVFEMAGEILPVSVRPSGNLAALMARAKAAGKAVDARFAVTYTHPKRPAVAERIRLEQLQAWTRDTDWPYLTHWTRTVAGPWPGETAQSYYDDLCCPPEDQSVCDSYPRSARLTVRRIVSERLLRGSDFRIREGRSVVAFTAQPPADALARMRYRRRFQHWNLEPYGLAIRRDRLQQLGASPVHYLGSEAMDVAATDVALVQGGATGKVDWSVEEEWRYVGSLDLTAIQADQAVVLVRNHEDAALLEPVSPWPVRVLTQDAECDSDRDSC